MHKQEAGEGERTEREGRGEDLDLCRAVQNAVDELDQLLHGLGRLTGQEVLLVGCVEDDNGGHCHLAEDEKKKQETAFNLLNLGTLDCHNQRASLHWSKLEILKEQTATQRI